MPRQRELIPETTDYPILGLDTATESTFLLAGATPDCLNMLLEDGILKKRPGYLQLGAVPLQRDASVARQNILISLKEI